jgi:hypothetical protein
METVTAAAHLKYIDKRLHEAEVTKPIRPQDDGLLGVRVLGEF